MANHGGLFLAGLPRLEMRTPRHRMIRTEEDDAYLDYAIAKGGVGEGLCASFVNSSQENGDRQRTGVAGACLRPISASAFVIERSPKLPVAVEVIRYGRAARSERIPI